MTFYESTIYYTKIDNTKIEKQKDNYTYNLKSYDENGKSKRITFDTTRILKDNAYLKIKYMITRGVISWEEVYYDDLPEKVKNKYK